MICDFSFINDEGGMTRMHGEDKKRGVCEDGFPSPQTVTPSAATRPEDQKVLMARRYNS